VAACGSKDVALALALWPACAFDTSSASDPSDLPPISKPFDAAELECDHPDIHACYRFEMNLLDGSEFANDASLDSGAVTYSEGFDGLTLTTGASNDISVAEAKSLDVESLTVEVAVSLGVAPTTRAGVFDNDGQWGLFIYAPGRPHCTFAFTDAAGMAIASQEIIPLNTWTHVGCTYDRRTGRAFLYVNGEVKNQALLSTAGLNPNGITGSAIAGNAPSGDPLTGRLDNLRIWSTALDADSVADLAAVVTDASSD
jgi:hypothetical protein